MGEQQASPVQPELDLWEVPVKRVASFAEVAYI